MTPSDWIITHCPPVPPGGTALDVACGNGRHAQFLVDAGWQVTVTDRDVSGVIDMQDHLEVIKTDLEAAPWPLPERQFDLVVVTNYLHRPLFADLQRAVRPGGWLLYETFMQGNEAFGQPRSPQFLLRPDELRDVFADWQFIAFDQGQKIRQGPPVSSCVIQSITVRKPELP
ncbi:MAG: methyltransferase domain-containing protein [Pseudomonadota bacterium]